MLCSNQDMQYANVISHVETQVTLNKEWLMLPHKKYLFYFLTLRLLLSGEITEYREDTLSAEGWAIYTVAGY